MLAKTNQALAALETYRLRLEQVLTRLTALEFQNAVVLDDVLVVLQRAEMTTRMVEEIERDCVELGVRGPADPHAARGDVGEVPGEKAAVVGDYHASDEPAEALRALERLAALSYQGLLERRGARGGARLPAQRQSARPRRRSPRGYRVLSHIPRLPRHVIRRVVGGLGRARGDRPRASQRELEAVDGVGAVRAREIREGLRRLQEHNLVDRYLQPLADATGRLDASRPGEARRRSPGLATLR